MYEGFSQPAEETLPQNKFSPIYVVVFIQFFHYILGTKILIFLLTEVFSHGSLV